MRITDAMIRERILCNMNASLNKVQIAQTQIATGKRVLKPSDDPMAISRSTKIKALLRDNEQFQKNISSAFAWIESSEHAVSQMVEVLTELKELAVDGASDTNGAPERAALALQANTLLERLVDLVNTTFDGRFIFAGTHTLTSPYSISSSVVDEGVVFTADEWLDLGNARIVEGSVTLSGGTVTFVEGTDYEIDYETGAVRRLAAGAMVPGTAYQISYDTESIAAVDLTVPATGGAINREIAQGVYEPINVGGEEILNSRVDIFSLMADVKNSLFRNDGEAVSQAIADIDSALDQASGTLAKIGAARNGFDLAQAKLDTENTNLKALISSLEDADLAEVLVNFRAEQTAYEAALAASATIMNTSLLNFLR
jgi:flagellar hook-associated protein 3 FlgL